MGVRAALMRSVRLALYVVALLVPVSAAGEEDRPWTVVGVNPDGTLRCVPVACHPPGYPCCIGSEQ
jgi:hypothetical protein